MIRRTCTAVFVLSFACAAETGDTNDLGGAGGTSGASGSGAVAGGGTAGVAAGSGGVAGSLGGGGVGGGAAGASGSSSGAGQGGDSGAAGASGGAGGSGTAGDSGAGGDGGAAGAAGAAAGAGGADDDISDDDIGDDDIADDDIGDDDIGDDDSGDDDSGDDDGAGGAGQVGDDDGNGDGECMVGTTAGNEVVFIGESFIAASSIAQETTNLARANGSLQQNESYLNASVSGTRMGDGAIPRQYTQTAASNPIRFVLMNGGGNDCLQANDPNAPIPAAEALYAEMAADGVEKVVYFFYPDAAGSFGGPTSSLQTCLNEYRPKIKALCDGLTAPKCYWLDLAETDWAGNEAAYTSDGIHPNGTGSKVTAEAIWSVMVENCVAQ